jgi:hypothetical protein
MSDPRLPASKPITKPTRQILRNDLRRKRPCARLCGKPLERWDDLVLHGNKLAHRACAEGFEQALVFAAAELAEIDAAQERGEECPTPIPTPSLPPPNRRRSIRRAKVPLPLIPTGR